LPEALSGRRSAIAALAALTLLAVALRSVGITGGLWLDEILTLVESVRHPLTRIVTTFPGNNQHTLYSVLAHLSVQAFGEQPWSLRLPALAFGAATPAMLYLFAREFTGRLEALLDALLIAVSYHHVWFSQNARGYTALAFFALLSSWLLLRGLRRGSIADFVGYAVACALGAYTHLTMVFLVLGQAAACALRLGPPVDRVALARWRLPLVGFALAGGITLALYAPLLLDVQRFFLTRTMPPDVATPAWAGKALLAGLQLGLGAAAGALAGALLLLVGLWSYYRQSRFLAGLFVLPGLFTVAAVLALRQPIFPRFLFFLSGFGVLIVVRGAIETGAWLSGKRKEGSAPVTLPALALVAAMTAAAAASLPFDYRYPKQDFEGAMRFVDMRRGAGEPVVTAGGAVYPFLEYYRRDWPGIRSAGALRDVRARGERVWMIYTLAEYIEADAPDLMRTLRDDCLVAEVFRGTVAGGDVTVCTLAPATMNAAESPAR
jgi:mannosyltransferase